MTALDDKEKEITKEQAKTQDIENQLSQFRNTNIHSQARAKRIADLEAAARKTQTLMSQAQSARDKDANAARARITSLENQLRVKTKEVDDQKVCVICDFMSNIPCKSPALRENSTVQRISKVMLTPTQQEVENAKKRKLDVDWRSGR